MSDIYGDQVSLLLHCEGADGSTKFQDSAYRNLVNVFGGAQISTAQKKFGTSSMFFDGNGDYLSIPSNTHFNTPGDFTVEFWMYSAVPWTSQAYYASIFNRGNLSAKKTDGYQDKILFTVGGVNCPSVSTPATGVWEHWALSRAAGTVYVFKNGVLEASYSAATAISTTDAFVIGQFSGYYFSGYLDEFRFTNGVGRYTANFTLATAAFDDPTIFVADTSPVYSNETKLLLHCEGAEASTNVFDSTNKSLPSVFGNARLSTAFKSSGTTSLYLDGTGDYVTFPQTKTNTEFNITGDFTLEFTIKPEGVGSVQRPIISTYASNWSQVWCYFDIRADGKLEAAFCAYRSILLVSDIVLVTGGVYHIAVTRSGTLAKMFINGVPQSQTATTSDSMLIGNMIAEGFRIGYNSQGGYYYQGYLDELRFTNGIARYTDRFVPPTAAFPDPVITNANDLPLYTDQTVLHLHCDGTQGSTIFGDSTRLNVVTAKGNAQLSETQKKFGVSSAYFDETGDYLWLPYNTNWDVGAQDFTLEMYFKGVSNTFSTLAVQRSAATFSAPFLLAVSDTYFQVYLNTTGTAWITSLTVPIATTTAFNHIALVRNGGVISLFVNGIQAATTTAVGASALYASTTPFVIGASDSTGAGATLNGYIDEFRFTKGIARYTTRFTPPVRAFDDPAIFKADDALSYWNETTLLMRMDGTGASTYFRDERHNNVAPIGNAQLSVGQKKFGAASALFDGNGDYLDVNNFGTLGAFGTGDFTIEADVFLLAGGAINTILDKANAYAAGNMDFRLEISALNRVAFLGGPDITWFGNVAETEVPVGRWVHIAVCRAGGTLRFFIDGVNVLSQAASFNIQNFKAQLRIGSINNSGSTGSFFNGYLDNVRITKGVARYTTRFVPPTKAFANPQQTDAHWDKVVLAMPFNGANAVEAMVDLKGNTFTTLGTTSVVASGKFNGSSAIWYGNASQVRTPITSNLNLINGESFTAEFWVSFTSNNGSTGVVTADAGWSAANGWGVTYNNGTLTVPLTTAASIQFAWTPTVGVWYHMALVGEGTTPGATYGIAKIKFYLDGTLRVSNNNTRAAVTTPAGDLVIGNDRGQIGFATNSDFNINGLRLTKGVARYVANFTPPTEPFPTAVPQALSGVVHDSSGNPIQRTARSYRRDTGALIGTAVSDPITGVFALPADNTDEHFVVVFDDTKNALIYDHVVPVI